MKLPRPVSGGLIPHSKLTALPRRARPEGGLSGPIPLLPPPERPAQKTPVGLCHKVLSLREAPLRKRDDWQIRCHRVPAVRPYLTRENWDMPTLPDCKAGASPRILPSGAARDQSLRRAAGLRQGAQGLLTPGGRRRESG